MVPSGKRTDLEVAVPELVPIGEYADEDVPATPVPDVSDDDEFYVRTLIRYGGPFTDGHETSVCWKWVNLGLMSFEDSRFTYMPFS
jgi:hypothetical protein